MAWLTIDEPLGTALSGAVVGTYTVSQGPIGICYDGKGAIWVGSNTNNTITKINSTTGNILGVYALPTGTGLASMASDGNLVFVAGFFLNNVTALSVADGSVVWSVSSEGTGPFGVCVAGSHIWVTNRTTGQAAKFFAADGTFVGAYSTGSAPQGICFDGTNVWAANSNDSTVTKLNAATGALVGTYSVGNFPRSVCFDGTNVWAANSNDSTVTKLNAATGALVGTYSVGVLPQGICFDGANIWVMNSSGSTASVLSASSGSLLGTFAAGVDPAQCCFDGYNGIWTADFVSGTAIQLAIHPGGPTDQTARMFKGSGNQNFWAQQLRQRGQASIHLTIKAGDTYAPTRLAPVYLSEQTASGTAVVFSGLIQDIENQYYGRRGDHYITITAVSLESVFDTIYAQPVQYVDQTCGAIVADLFARFEAGCPVALGTIQAGATVPLLNVARGDKISDVFTQLATTSQFVWGVDPSTQKLFFRDPFTFAAPFTLLSENILWDTVDWKVKGADYRNRQGIRLSYDAFPHSMEFFSVTDKAQTFTLRRPVAQVTNCYVTLSTCNTATGSFSGNPSPGDTVTIEPAGSAWVANRIYALGGVVNVDGFVFSVTTAGTSGGSPPTWDFTTGATTADFTVVWTCLGPSGLATGVNTYTFVSVLDNTQFGQVLIGANAAATCQNLADAINANPAVRNDTPSNTVSLPTWENSQCNAIGVSGSSFTLQQKAAGSGWVAALSTTSSAFSWSAPFTAGGTSPNGSVGPSQGATWSIQVYAAGTNSAPNSLIFTPGSNVVTLATPLPVVPANLNIEYTRYDGDSIEVEDTALVAQLALLTHGTGKYQQFTDQSSTGLISTSSAAGLQLAQQALASYSIPPQEFTFDTFVSGLQVGMTLPVSLSYPLGVGTLLGGYIPIDWVVESVDAELIPVSSSVATPWLPGFGHFRYTIHCINISEVGSWLDFWNGVSGGGGGASGGAGGVASGLVSTSGGALQPQPGAIIVCTQSQIAALLPIGADTILAVKDFPHLILFDGSSFSWLDDGSNYYAFGDVAAPSWATLPGPNGPWVACDGSTVSYLNPDGTLSTKTLPNVVGGAHFLELGNGTGSFASESTGTVSGTVSVTGSVFVSSVVVDGSVSIDSITVTGSVSLSGITVHGNVNGAVVTLSDVGGHTSFSNVVSWINDGNVTVDLSGGSVDVSGLSVDLSAVTVDNEGDLSVDMSDLEISSELTGVTVNSGNANISDPQHSHELDVISSSNEGESPVFTLGSSSTFSSLTGITDSGHGHSITDPKHSHNGLGSLAVTGTPGLTGDAVISGGATLSGSIAASAAGAPDNGTFVFDSGAGSVTSSTFTQTSITGSGSWSQTGGSGTATWTQTGGSASASWSQTGGSIFGTSSGSKPAAWLMQARFRI